MNEFKFRKKLFKLILFSLYKKYKKNGNTNSNEKIWWF